jgi:zinc/manganese transport system substrate-binding protein
MITRRRILSVLAAAPVCSAFPAAAQERLQTVATFSILGDFVRQVGGEKVAITSLVGPDGDAHTFEPSPRDGKTLAAAQLVIANGLGFDNWITRLIKASRTRAQVVVATKGIAPIQGVGENRGKDDPHAWQSVANARIYVSNIRDGLIAADAGSRDVYLRNATDYLAKLGALDAEVRASIANIPQDRRRIITTHDAFGYFASAYGMTFLAPQGVSTESEASSRDVAKIIRQILAEKIPAVFLENVTDPRLIKRIAAETGAKIGKPLYSDALSPPTGPAANYVDMMRNNAAALVEALAG